MRALRLQGPPARNDPANTTRRPKSIGHHHPHHHLEDPLTQLPPAPAQPYGPRRALESPSLRYAHRSFRSVNGLGTAVSILICLVALAQAVLAASEWYTYKVVKDYVEGPVKDPDRLDGADEVVSWPSAAGCSRCWPRASCLLSGSGGPGVTLNSSAVDSIGAVAAG